MIYFGNGAQSINYNEDNLENATQYYDNDYISIRSADGFDCGPTDNDKFDETQNSDENLRK